ncbi:MAG: sigma-70 family RNA polymerase sigma factor [Candidatus Nanopelagicales bacterium]|nr:sigma-70 family RNA polymerase sigma factor [Candidatus Nanopelagicales bacterium]
MTLTLTLARGMPVADPTPANGPPDAALWAALLGGDLDAFDTLYDRHAEAVHRLLVRRVGAQDAPDLTAEVFTRAWAHRDRIRVAESGGLRPWLLGTALNVARGHIERTAAAGQLAQRLAGQGSPPEGPIGDTIDRLDDAVALPHAHAALASLSLDDQEVLLLCVLEGLTPTDAALALGQRPGSVRSRLTRARRRLANAYERTWAEGSRP